MDSHDGDYVFTYRLIVPPESDNIQLARAGPLLEKADDRLREVWNAILGRENQSTP